jgi:hypothetical protein
MSVEKPASSPEGGSRAQGAPDGKASRRRSFRSKRRNRNKPNAEAASPSRSAPAPTEAEDKAQRERRERRRRRRMKMKQRGQADAAAERVVEDIMKDLPSLKPVFVYTHVIRPSVRDSYEFRTEHFGKVTRRLEDFNIDLMPFFRSVEEDEARLAARERAEAAGIDPDAWDDDLDEDWDDEDENEDEESGDDTAPAAGPTAEAGDADPVDLDPTDNDDPLL